MDHTLNLLYPYLINAFVAISVTILFLPAQYLPQHPLYSLVQWLELYAYKVHTKFVESPKKTPVRVILFDEEFFCKNNDVRKSPLDRKTLAKLLDNLSDLKPKVVAIDIDICYQLRPMLEETSPIYSFSHQWLNEIEQADRNLVESINNLTCKTCVVLPLLEPRYENSKRMEYVESNNLYYGNPRAAIRDPDRVIYELPVWEPNWESNLPGISYLQKPSFALITWKAYFDFPDSYFLTGKIPPNIDEKKVRDISFFEKQPPFVNYGYRVSSDETLPAFRPLSATHFLGNNNKISDAIKNDFKGKVILIGRNSYLQNPIVEREDYYPIPYINKRLSGVFLQGIFVDNLLNRLWLTKINWFQGAFLTTLISILLGWTIISVSQYATENQLPLLNPLFSDPIQSLGFGILIATIVTFIVNLIFLKKGIYTISFAIIPLTSYMEAVLQILLKK